MGRSREEEGRMLRTLERRWERKRDDEGNINRHERVTYTVEHEKVENEARKWRTS